MQEHQPSPWQSATTWAAQKAVNFASGVINIAKPILIVTLTLPFKKVGADLVNICFELPGGIFDTHDNTLDCGQTQQNLTAIKGVLTAKGATFDSGDQDCATFFTDSVAFKSGVFGGDACTLYFHEGNPPNQDTSNGLNNVIKSGYGTTYDIISTTAIIVGGLIAIGVACHCMFKINRRNNSSVMSEETPVFSDTNSIDREAPVGNKVGNNTGYQQIV